MDTIDNNGAWLLLEAMVKDSASDFEGGVRTYIEGTKLETEGRRMLDNAIAKLGRARDKKDAGLRLIKAEYKFLMGQEPVHPHVDGHYVMARLIKELIESMDKDEAEDFLQKFMPSEEIEKAIVEETETEEATNGETDIQETP